jgi:hypothetical protein
MYTDCDPHDEVLGPFDDTPFDAEKV